MNLLVGGIVGNMPPGNIVDLLVRDEGEVLHAYQDTLGYWTIGVGRMIDLRKGGGISQEESRILLANDIHRNDRQLQEQLPWTAGLDEVRYAVLQSMCFNLGLSGLLQFKKFLTLMQAGDYAGASQEMLASTWAEQVPSRANRLSIQITTGQWQ